MPMLLLPTKSTLKYLKIDIWGSFFILLVGFIGCLFIPTIGVIAIFIYGCWTFTMTSIASNETWKYLGVSLEEYLLKKDHNGNR